jgi:hypothetical protein
MTIPQLFRVAIDGPTKVERRNGFRELRRLSLYGEREEMAEARDAIENSAAYLKQLETTQ